MTAYQDIVKHRHLFKQGYILERPGYSQSSPSMGFKCGNVLPFKSDGAKLRMVEATYTVKQGGLSGTIRADYSKQLSLADVKRNTVQRGNTTKTKSYIVAGKKCQCMAPAKNVKS